MSVDIELQYDRIYRYCYFRLHDAVLAEDVTQETFLRYFDRGPQLSGDASLKYLYTIARNLCIDAYRRPKTEPPDDTLPALDTEDAQLTSIALRRAIAALSEEDRELLLLRYVNEVPVGVMAKVLGLSRFALHRRLNAAADRFRSHLRKEDLHE